MFQFDIKDSYNCNHGRLNHYRALLKHICEKEGLRYMFGLCDRNTAYISLSKRCIEVGSQWYDENVLGVVSMMHEIGHWIDFKDNYKKYDPGINVIIYQNTDNKINEVEAWLYGIDVGCEIGFIEWEAYVDIARQALKTYMHLNIEVDAAVEGIKHKIKTKNKETAVS